MHLTTNVAIYCRKSTEQFAADKMRSVERQEEDARACAETHGWKVDAAHVFVDDGISGAEFDRRPGLQRLITLVTSGRRTIAKVLVTDMSRFGREMVETQYLVKRFAKAGVELWDVRNDKSLTPKRSLDKILNSVQSFSDDNYREEIAIKVHSAHSKQFLNGQNVGGCPFGYDNVKVYQDNDPNKKKLYSKLEVNPAQAAVVRRIFDLFVYGHGLRKIAGILNNEGAPCVKHAKAEGLSPFKGWAPSTIRGVLRRETYRGVVIWNKTKKKDDWGETVPRSPKRPESEWIRTTNESLRIISDDLWNQAHSRMRHSEGNAVRLEGGRLCGRPPKGEAKNLLAGFAKCGVCGGGLVVDHSNNRKHAYSFYVCNRRRVNGSCTNTLRIRTDLINEAVYQAIEEHALTSDAIEQVRLYSERAEISDRRTELAAERTNVERQIDRMTEAIAKGGAFDSFLDKLRALETRRKDIDGELKDLRPIPKVAPEVIETRLAEWRRLLRGSVVQGRTVLQRVLSERITFTPREDGAGYDFTAPTRFDRLFNGIVIGPADRPSFIPEGDRTGAENIGPEDTGEQRYEELLERTGKVWRARQDSNLRPPA